MRGSSQAVRRSIRIVVVSAITATFFTSASAEEASGSYAQRYAASRDLSGFITQRAASPTEGSYFYAYLARWECADDGGIARRVAPKALIDEDARRVDATRRQLARCANVPGEETTIGAQASDVQTGRRSGDRVFAAFHGGERARWFVPSDPDDFAKALAIYADSTTPDIVWIVGQQLAQASWLFQVDGHVLGEREKRSLYMAFLLATCDGRVDCGPTHRWMRNMCIQNGGAACADANLEARWRRTSTGQPPGWTDWDEVHRFVDRIAASVRSRDWSAFTMVSEASR